MRIVALTAALVLTVGVAGARAEGIVPVEGSWGGESSAGLPVHFGVAGDRVVNTRFKFKWGFCGTFQSHDPNASVEIDSSRHWIYEDPRGQTLEGTFVAPDRVEGTIVAVERMLPGCPRTEATFIAAPVPPAPEVEPGPRVCEVRSRQVIGGSVRGRVTAEHVTAANAAAAGCGRAKKVMTRVVALRLQEDRRVQGFNCETDVVGYHPLMAVYTCRYHAPLARLRVKLHFAVAFRGKSR
jgi:hypothetical protein